MYTEAAPDIPHAWHMYGHDLMKTGNIDEAIIKFSMALDLEKKKYDREDMPYHYDWHYPHNLELLAYCYQYKGQFENAKAIFVQLDTIQAFQEESEGKIRKGHPFFLLQNGEYDEAIYLADKLAKGEGINTKLVANISSGLAHMMKRDEKNAMKSTGEIQILLDSLVNEVSKYGIPEEMFTSSSYFQFYKGLQDLIENGLVLQKDPENIEIKEKIETFQKQMLSQTGPDPWIESLYFLQLLSNITYSTGNMELAESSAKALLEHDPEFGGGLYAMARVQKRKNNETAASESMAKAKLAYKDGDEELLKRLGF
jgi:tetratricopeptide (TPR) repeat protein